MKVYIAGPMTGIPRFNFPAFDAAATDLRDLGFDVVSPAELDNPETRRTALASPDGAPGTGSHAGETWADFLSRDVKLIADEVDAVAVLPGWERSRGARLETFVARLCGDDVYRYVPPEDRAEMSTMALVPMTDDELNRIMGYGDPGVPSADPEVNPKELRAAADGKDPLDFLEPALDAEKAHVMRHGAEKYGYRNYTVTPCKVRTYIGAVQRHLRAIRLGQDVDPDSGRSHWAHISACCDVVAGAELAGMLVDDREAYATQLSDRVHIDGDLDAKALTAAYNDTSGEG